MSIELEIVDQKLHQDPALGHFAIQLEEQRRHCWRLQGLVPVEGIKRRAGTLVRHLAPPSVWLINDIVVDPGDKVDGVGVESILSPEEGVIRGVA